MMRSEELKTLESGSDYRLLPEVAPRTMVMEHCIAKVVFPHFRENGLSTEAHRTVTLSSGAGHQTAVCVILQRFHQLLTAKFLLFQFFNRHQLPGIVAVLFFMPAFQFTSFSTELNTPSDETAEISEQIKRVSGDKSDGKTDEQTNDSRREILLDNVEKLYHESTVLCGIVFGFIIGIGTVYGFIIALRCGHFNPDHNEMQNKEKKQ
ncbi:MAG: hypothetical protein HPZ91_05970 [Lentisphaeria bacterium]|nr:hypothetical protein [Lentisphaeria bacterium]